MSTLRPLGTALAAACCFVALSLAPALAAPPAPPPAPPAVAAPPAAPAPPVVAPVPAPAPLACPSGQACGDRCIPWTEVCAAGLADSLGYAPASADPPADPGNAPPGSTMLALPRLTGPTAPGVRDGAPPWCLTGLDGGGQPPLECMAWYQVGRAESTLSPTTATQDCPQDQKCAGVCLEKGQVCPSVEHNQSKRLDPFEPGATSPGGFR